ncbi:MAG: 6-phosphofructokinase [Bacteroidales bacterium]|jgi:6-phosphofructokinase 1|nr:6-phosphofructokinase [Bacteroidales bacterium]MDY2936038.1 6-phosphofructokinase [Candidatus Cryptobacteroides sp.]MCI5718884.1 6-phosphofructokinase [Bacteroidales bacterium]MDD7088605.1 6-phosphofructokinase [Bacteroidales bacterium]MDY6319543.1 6-phosphofructokinase [Bacteroidales bacterium]
MKDSIIILCGGGPAPGMNTVVFSVAKTFLSNGYRVIGLHEGYTGLFNDHPRTEDIDFFKADAYFNRGGSYLQMSRFKPTNEDFEKNFNLKLFQENNVKLLVTVGGDDTASTANRIAKFLEAKQYPIHNIHVPKTIDDDLPLPNNAPTFGFNSAKDEGAHLARTIYEDARTSGNWLLISAMGRSAGHLALGIGEATHCPMTIIPEMFNKTKITVDKIIKLTLSAIIKRKLLGIHYGTVVVAEGVFHDLDSDDLKGTGVHMTYDEHGHPELGKISKAVLFNDILEKEFSKLGWKVKTRPVEIGYDVRCQDPIAYDLSYCTELAMGVYELFKEGKTGCMVYIDQDGNPKPLFLKDIQNAEGKIPPRRVDIDGGLARNYYEHLCHYITPADYEAAKEWVSNPEEYDFKKILNW